jgi:hypothetical protein
MTVLLQALLIAYVLPSGVLLRQMAVHHSDLLPERYDIAGSLTLTGDEAKRGAQVLGLSPADPLVVSTKLAFTPGKCTVEISGAQHVTATNTAGSVTFDPPAAAGNAEFAGWLARLGCMPFLFRGESSAGDYEAFFKKAGGTLDDSALSLEGSEVAYIIGAGETGTGKLGLVVQKRDRTPLRSWETSGGVKVEARFQDYRPVFRGGGFPTVIELRSGEQLVARFTATP